MILLLQKVNYVDLGWDSFKTWFIIILYRHLKSSAKKSYDFENEAEAEHRG